MVLALEGEGLREFPANVGLRRANVNIGCAKTFFLSAHLAHTSVFDRVRRRGP
jgi:hypothetical protein